MNKNRMDIPLVSHPEQIIGHWEPSVAADHSLPMHHARTEALGVTILIALILGGACLAIGASLQTVALAAFVTAIAGLLVFLYRYEAHVSYVRTNREPLELDIDHDGAPDRVKAVYYGGGAPKAASNLDALYRQRFAEFLQACQQGTDVRSLRSAGFDDTQQALFRGVLIEHGAGTWLNTEAHTLGWALGAPTQVQRVQRCTAWEPQTT